MSKGQKTYDDFCADDRKIALDKQALATPIGNVLFHTEMNFSKETGKIAQIV